MRNKYSARHLNSTFWEVISVFDSWFLVLFLSDIEPYNFVENFFTEVAESEKILSVKGISLD